MTATVEALDTEAVQEANTEGARRGRKTDRDFKAVKPVHEKFAEWVKETYGVEIDPVSVKAAWLARGEFNASEAGISLRGTPEERAQRKADAEERKKAREAERARYANETPEEKAARVNRKKIEAQAERAQKRAAELQRRAEELREQAGLITPENVEIPAETPEAEAANGHDGPAADDVPSAPAKRRKRPATV